MQREERVRAGCWRLALLSGVLVLHLVPLRVHGNGGGTNATELDVTANATSLLGQEAGPAEVTEISVSTSPAAISTVTARAGRMPRAGEEEEQSSGMFVETAVPVVEEVGVASAPQLIPDSAEMEHLLPGSPRGPEILEGEEEEEEEEERSPHANPPWIHAKDISVFSLDPPPTTHTAPPPPATNPPNPDVLHVDFFDPSSRERGLNLAPPSPSSLAHELQGGVPTSWAMPDNYDYLTPYEDGVSPTSDEYAYSPTTDAYESDEDLRLSAGSRPKPLVPASGPIIPGAGAPLPNFPVAAPPAAAPVDGSDGMGGCRVGYQMVNQSCRSPCDMQPNFCFNGGQCHLLEGAGVFCRCNIQDYIWHKGARCEAVVTEFQVMCLAVGASAVVVLLLFMIVVCFAKKLHVLKTENKKLRKCSSKYRPTSEQHNDNFSLSTIAEGSHPNDDPNSQNKLEDPVKASPKEDDSLNIHNSLTPKHENHKVLGEGEAPEVNSLQNNMM